MPADHDTNFALRPFLAVIAKTMGAMGLFLLLGFALEQFHGNVGHFDARTVAMFTALGFVLGYARAYLAFCTFPRRPHLLIVGALLGGMLYATAFSVGSVTARRNVSLDTALTGLWDELPGNMAFGIVGAAFQLYGIAMVVAVARRLFAR